MRKKRIGRKGRFPEGGISGFKAACRESGEVRVNSRRRGDLPSVFGSCCVFRCAANGGCITSYRTVLHQSAPRACCAWTTARSDIAEATARRRAPRRIFCLHAWARRIASSACRVFVRLPRDRGESLPRIRSRRHPRRQRKCTTEFFAAFPSI